jgi:nitrile hydratase accessory protein
VSTSPAPGLLDVDGPAAPPRTNGELVFAEPWESKAFGLALALHAGGVFAWEEFRQQLIAVIAAWDSDHQPDEGWSYYGCWLTALQQLLARRGLVDEADLEARVQLLAARPHGHDHRHE